jgi:lipoteichoic acid synthase
MDTSVVRDILKRTGEFVGAAFLPVLLVLLFVAQNAAFNLWLHIVPQIYPQMYFAVFALGMVLYAPAACLRPDRRHAYLLLMSALLSVLFIAEYLYYSYAGGFLQVSALKLTGETGAVMGTATRFVTPRIILFVSNFLLVAFVVICARYRKSLSVTLTLGGKIAVVVLIAVSVFGGYGTLLAAEKNQWGDDTRLYSQLFDLNDVVGKMGVVNYFLEDAAKRVIASGRVTDDDKAFVAQWAASRPAPAVHGSTFGIAKGRNLIFIQVESLENADIGTKVGGAEITPNLDALAHEGLYFSNYFAQVGMGNTADAEFTTLNSLYALPDSVAFVDDAQNRYAALPQLLAGHGYATEAFHGDVATFWNRANIYPNLGYQKWSSLEDYVSHRYIGITGLGDEDFFTQTLPRVEALPQPFMATLITLSSHTPFILPDDLRTLAIPAASGLNDTQTQYLESIHYADKAIGEFMDQLKQSDIYDHSVIVIYGDHGSYTGISKALGVEGGDVDSMNDAQVPLIIIAPGTGLTGERTMPASHLDLYPTVASLLGVDAPASVLGQDLLATATPVAVHRKSGTGGVSAIVGAKLIYTASDDGVFADGRCLAADSRTPVSIDECRSLYDQQSAIIRVSDAVVRGNLINELSP